METINFVIPIPTREYGADTVLRSLHGIRYRERHKRNRCYRSCESIQKISFEALELHASYLHDREPRFMSEVFQYFSEMMGSKRKATLSYRPQANGQKSNVKKMIDTVAVYVEDPL